MNLLRKPKYFTTGDIFIKPSRVTKSFVLNTHEKKAGIPFLLVSFLIAFSRMYLYVHYPSDVLAGMLAGIFSGYLACLLARKISICELYKKIKARFHQKEL